MPVNQVVCCLLWKNVSSDLVPFCNFFFVRLFVFDVGYLSCLYIFSINLLAVVSLANIFSHLLCCLSFIDGFLCCTKLLSSVRSHLFSFAFVSFALEDMYPIMLLQFTAKSVLPIFSSGVLWFFGLMFRSLSHLSLVLYIIIRNVLFIFFYM